MLYVISLPDRMHFKQELYGLMSLVILGSWLQQLELWLG